MTGYCNMTIWFAKNYEFSETTIPTPMWGAHDHWQSPSWLLKRKCVDEKGHIWISPKGIYIRRGEEQQQHWAKEPMQRSRKTGSFPHMCRFSPTGFFPHMKVLMHLCWYACNVHFHCKEAQRLKGECWETTRMPHISHDIPHRLV